jgi:type III pantothenate kinase
MRLLNIGNTTTELATLNGKGQLSGISRMPSAEIANRIPELSRESVAVASVVPAITDLLQMAIPNLKLLTAESATSVDFSQVDGRTLGADRVANALAAAALLPLPAVIVDCGTAITFEVIAAGPVFRGGAILPGRAMCASALRGSTAQLPKIGLSAAIPKPCGTDTASAVAAGIGIGSIGAIREILRRLGPEAGQAYVTGGDSDYFLLNVSELRRAPAHFTLRGIAEFAGAQAR